MVKPRAILRQLAGTGLAILAGWFAALVFVEIATLVEIVFGHSGTVPAALLGTLLAFGIYMWLFIVPVWLLAFVPLYLFVPRSSRLWSWPICASLGGLAGFLLMSAVSLWVGFGGTDYWTFYIAAAIVGGVASLTASLTRERFTPTI